MATFCTSQNQVRQVFSTTSMSNIQNTTVVVNIAQLVYLFNRRVPRR